MSTAASAVSHFRPLPSLSASVRPLPARKWRQNGARHIGRRSARNIAGAQPSCVAMSIVTETGRRNLADAFRQRGMWDHVRALGACEWKGDFYGSGCGTSACRPTTVTTRSCPGACPTRAAARRRPIGQQPVPSSASTSPAAGESDASAARPYGSTRSASSRRARCALAGERRPSGTVTLKVRASARRPRPGDPAQRATTRDRSRC